MICIAKLRFFLTFSDSVFLFIPTYKLNFNKILLYTWETFKYYQK
jgi:hypothetical protein